MTVPATPLNSQAPSSMVRFFWECAGASEDILRECPYSERVKYASIGGLVLGTAILAWISSTFALWSVFAKTGLVGQFSALLAGVLWGLFIFNLDRFVVSSTGKGDGTSTISLPEFINALPRLAMALVIGIAVSTPLELQIFKPEIDAKIDQFASEQRQQIEAELTREFTDIPKLETELNRLETQVVESREQLRKADDQVAGEVAGRIGSGKPGDGPSTREARILAQKRKEALSADSSALRDRGGVLRDSIGKLMVVRITAKQARERTVSAFDGLAMRLRAGHEVAGAWTEWMLRLLFILVEVAPVLFKLMIAKGPYDYLSENQANLVRARYGILVIDDVIHPVAGAEQGQQFDAPQHVQQTRFLEVEFETSQREDAMRHALAVSNREMQVWREQQEGEIARMSKTDSSPDVVSV